MRIIIILNFVLWGTACYLNEVKKNVSPDVVFHVDSNRTDIVELPRPNDECITLNSHSFKVGFFDVLHKNSNDLGYYFEQEHNGKPIERTTHFNRWYDGETDTVKYNTFSTYRINNDTIEVVGFYRNGKYQTSIRFASIWDKSLTFKNNVKVGMLYTDFIKNIPELKESGQTKLCVTFDDAIGAEELTFYFVGAPLKLNSISYFINIYD